MKLALKLPHLNRNWLMLSGAIALGLVATGLSHKLLREHMAQLDAQMRAKHQMVKVVVPVRNLPRGVRIEAGLFATRSIPQDYVRSSAVSPKYFGQFIGQRLGTPLKAGETLQAEDVESPSQVFSSTLENGNRALTTEVDEINSISGMLRPTDHIDLMVTAHGTGRQSADVTFTLLSNVEVLATGQVTRTRQDTKEARTYTTITLSVSPQDAERIVVAKNSGKLTAVLRSPEDKDPNATAAMNIDDVMPKRSTAGSHQRAVQYIVGGRT